MLASAECLLCLLQQYIGHPNKLKQLQALMITHGYLHFDSYDTSKFRWMSTLLFNTLIRAHLNIGKTYKAILLFKHMLDYGSPPNSFTFPSLIKAASTSPLWASSIGRTLQTHVTKGGLLFDPFIHTSFISLYACMGSLLDARKMFEELPEPCVVSCNAMLDVYAKNGDMGSAIRLFERMPMRDIFSWTSMINGFGITGCYGELIRFFWKMMVNEDVIRGIVRPNEATFVSCLAACSNSDSRGALYQGKQVHGYIIKTETELTCFMGTALITLYGKVGYLSSAKNVFDQLKEKQVCAWNALISSMASNGLEKEALIMFQKMKEQEIRPTGITFVAILTACSRGRYVNLGFELFESMSRDFDIVPKMEHYGCMVDLLGRAGLLMEAEDFMKRMPFEPDDTVLGALLGACKVHGVIELGNEVGRRLLEVDPSHTSRYVALSTINASAGKWGFAAEWRKAMAVFGVQRAPGYSLIHPS
ncbi:hypothetical protein Droror1_Dr00015384 [Drosera rotundifolia]